MKEIFVGKSPETRALKSQKNMLDLLLSSYGYEFSPIIEYNIELLDQYKQAVLKREIFSRTAIHYGNAQFSRKPLHIITLARQHEEITQYLALKTDEIQSDQGDTIKCRYITIVNLTPDDEKDVLTVLQLPYEIIEESSGAVAARNDLSSHLKIAATIAPPCNLMIEWTNPNLQQKNTPLILYKVNSTSAEVTRLEHNRTQTGITEMTLVEKRKQWRCPAWNRYPLDATHPFTGFVTHHLKKYAEPIAWQLQGLSH